MKARLQMIGDYDEESKTYAVMLVADESEVDFGEFNDGDEVEVSKICNAAGQGRREATYPERDCSGSASTTKGA